MKNLRVIISGISSAITLAALNASITVAQVQGGVRSGAQAAQGTDQPTYIFGDGAIFETVVNTLLFLIGAIAVIMLIFGGFRYVISGGNATSVTAAKNTILYAIVGVVVALLAYAAIDFVLASIENSSGNTGL